MNIVLQEYLFTATYSNGKVTIFDETFDAGYFSVELLNFNRHDSRFISQAVKFNNNDFLITYLQDAHINKKSFSKAPIEYMNLFDYICNLSPFKKETLDLQMKEIELLFSERNFDLINNHISTLCKAVANNQMLHHSDRFQSDDDKLYYKIIKTIGNIKHIYNMYRPILKDIVSLKVHLKSFISKADSAKRFDESHLLPIAHDIFSDIYLSDIKQYTVVQNKNKSTLGNTLSFDSYLNFVITDFFEGLHYGHYPKQCPICHRYFLMTTAIRQKYCNGYAPFLYKDKKISCRKYGAKLKKKESADANPVKKLCENRCSNFRTKYCRGQITKELCEAGQKLARNRKQKAIKDTEYANFQYIKDMEMDNLLNDASRGCVI